mmetsp:Transcript_2133/g.5152  ORF Transcript_2133/g.5152 Transcript_2133/m.5152 type:complete len:263 (-) Transcript_2133:317-1105(-)
MFPGEEHGRSSSKGMADGLNLKLADCGFLRFTRRAPELNCLVGTNCGLPSPPALKRGSEPAVATSRPTSCWRWARAAAWVSASCTSPSCIRAWLCARLLTSTATRCWASSNVPGSTPGVFRDENSQVAATVPGLGLDASCNSGIAASDPLPADLLREREGRLSSTGSISRAGGLPLGLGGGCGGVPGETAPEVPKTPAPKRDWGVNMDGPSDPSSVDSVATWLGEAASNFTTFLGDGTISRARRLPWLGADWGRLRRGLLMS